MKKIGRFLTVASISLVAALGVAVAVVAWVALEEQPLWTPSGILTLLRYGELGRF